MYIFDIQNKSYLKDVLLENLKLLGVRGRLPKKTKENDKENLVAGNQIFQRPLHSLKKCITFRLNGSKLEVPEFIVDACSVIEKNITVEGIFRKAGSTCKQKERKLELNQGKKVSCDYHVFDACSLVKLFFRELPQPVIPYLYHELFLKCLLLSTYEKEVEALMLACLLLPEEHIAVLAFFMEFLLKVSFQAEANKMTVKNLAIILTPTLMPVSKETRASNSVEMANHFKIIEMLIKNSEKIGKVPDQISENILSVRSKKTKKKRRSGSLTRMFTGLKKIVGNRNSTAADSESLASLTPESLSSVRKRKNIDSASALGLSAKKKLLLDCGSGNLSPRCRMQGYAPTAFFLNSPSNTKKTRLRSPNDKGLQNHHLNDKTLSERKPCEGRTSRLNLVRRCTVKNPQTEKHVTKANGMESLFKAEAEKIAIDKKFTVKTCPYTKNSTNELTINEGQSDYLDDCCEKAIDLSNELITVHRSEYEDIKNRVSALEEDLELLATVHSVQCAYEKTLEESERLNAGSTEKLAKRLSQELKIRLSSDNKIIRSPSARKIGSIRRRSQETCLKYSEQKTNLKRGRPNTLRTGLPSPRTRTASTENICVTNINSINRSTSKVSKEDWKTGEIFFSKEHLFQKISPATNRPSLAEIRCQNAGMVLEKTKLFNALNAKNEIGATKVWRRQSVRLENLRRMNDSNQLEKKILTRTRSLGSDKKPKSTALLLMEGGIQSKINPDLQIMEQKVCTPNCLRLQGSSLSSRATPAIKKSLNTRSPRSLAKTPMSHLRSGNRTRTTPMKALPEAGTTPHLGLRRSPRLLVRSINTPSRLRE